MAQITETVDPVFHFVSKSYCEGVVSNFRQQRLERQFLDVTLKAGDTTIVAHRSFLAAFAKYFATLFSSGMMESTMSEVNLRDIDGTALSQIIDFAYSGELEITPNNVSVILETSNYLGIDSICEACCDYLYSRLTTENVIDVLILASTFDCTELFKRAKLYALEHFEQLTGAAAFVDMKPSLLLELVSDDRLVYTEDGFCVNSARQEQRVLQSVIRYVTHDVTNRVGFLSEFLSAGVRLSLISDDMLHNARESVVKYPEVAAAMETSIREMPANPKGIRRSMNGLKYECSQSVGETSALRVSLQQSQEHDDSKVPPEEGRYVTGMKVYVRLWDGRPVIGGLKVKYSSGEVVQLGGDLFPDGETHEFLMEPNERIVGSVVRAGWMVDQLTFISSQRRSYGPYGGSGGSVRQLDPSNKRGAYLAGLRCRIDYAQEFTSIRHLSLVWAYYRYSK